MDSQQTFVRSVWGGVQILGGVLGPLSEEDKRRLERAKRICPDSSIGWRGWPGTPSWGSTTNTEFKHPHGQMLPTSEQCPTWLAILLGLIAVGSAIAIFV